MYIESVRESLLKEAKLSPNLLSDLAGLENYIAESYHNRSFIELLQNADDAKATRFKILKHENYLFVANNGRVFNQEDLESLCRSASSNKVRGESIGYRGIGFKSVVGFSKEIFVISGELELIFSKERTLNEIPQASRVPLIRIPHKLNGQDKILFQPLLEQFKSDGFTTVFIFSGVTASEIEFEFEAFENNCLIFLKNISQTELCFNGKPVITKINKETIKENEIYITFENSTDSKWLVSNTDQISVAFSIRDNQIIKLPESEALVHAFLPTEDQSGFGILVNGNFDTDPSRRHVIFDEASLNSIKNCSNYILSTLEKSLNTPINSHNLALVRALIPYSDPRVLQFKKSSFIKLLLDELKNAKSAFFSNLKLCPVWLNSKDYAKLSIYQTLDNRFAEIEGFKAFAKYLGAVEDSFTSVCERINKTEISVLGCAQLTQYVFKTLLSLNGKDFSNYLNYRILMSNNKRISLHELDQNKTTLDHSFISLLLENGITEFDIKQVFKKYTSIEEVISFVSEQPSSISILVNSKNSPSVLDWLDQSKSVTGNLIKTNLKRWRSAEEQTMILLNELGFTIQDVSKQNIGYDLEGTDPNGKQIQIEVKSITLPGQRFKLTNNEIAIAREKQNSYYVAIVRQTDDKFEIALIQDPVNKLTLNRQCVQWIWECSEYEYNPISFEL